MIKLPFPCGSPLDFEVWYISLVCSMTGVHSVRSSQTAVQYFTRRCMCRCLQQSSSVVILGCRAMGLDGSELSGRSIKMAYAQPKQAA